MMRIVLAVDGSDHSLRAADMAGMLSKALVAPVHVLNVVPDSAVVTTGPIHEYARIEKVTITQRALLQSAGTQVADDAASRVKEAGGEVAATEVLIGSPAHEITQYAEDVGADCIVRGRRGLGEIKGLFMGSVSHRVGQLSEITLITTQ